MKARNSAIDTIAARKRSEEVMAFAAHSVSRARRSTKRSEVLRCRTGTRGYDSSRRLPDREAVEIILRSSRVEGLAHHHKAFAGGSRRRQPGLTHQLGGV